MFNKFKPAFILSVFLLFSCTGKQKSEYVTLQGNAQGTTYQITYKDTAERNFQYQIDSILKAIDLSLSTYKEASVISAFNNSDSGVMIDYHMKEIYLKAKEIHQQTGGAFDPTVQPLVKFWGFHKKTSPVHADTTELDSILLLIGMEKVQLVNNDGKHFLWKSSPATQLDFNAIAQGYTVDVLAAFLSKHQIGDFMIELGGEMIVKGKNSEGKNWKIGIDKPLEKSDVENRELNAILEITDKAVATSGNYRKFYEKDGVKFSHTLNPITGKPVKHSLLSITVVGENCMEADAYATAFMVMGTEKTIKFLQESADLDGYLIWDNGNKGWESYTSANLEDKIHKTN